MSNLSKSHYRLSLAEPLQRRIAISLSTVVLVNLLVTSIGFSAAVSAKPRPSAPVVTSQTPKDRISPQPVEAVLANIQPKPSIRSKVLGATSRSVVKSSQSSTRQVKTDRFFQGISHLIDTDRQTDVSPVDRLIK
ncbi:hypothetical protein [Chamaesiphon sp. GL140_3_metabinner_50]|uniref:hypothetical protein n=1 Tax=Chamaesiphon sp. GL140_3_metabinner_50 TaxID=2970812 RepID=UPI0025EC616A|nr:hypothetical protein [Chamaesiphon sp. GL140_3_metabinner_50]